MVSGQRTIVGLYPSAATHFAGIREGLLSLAQLVPQPLRTEALIARLNEYYVTEYTPALDLEIVMRYFQQQRQQQ